MATPFAGCDLTGKTPKVMLVNGTGDKICPCYGGELNVFGIKKVFEIAAQATVEQFVKRNGVDSIPEKNYLAHLNSTDQTSVGKIAISNSLRYFKLSISWLEFCPI